MRWSDGIFSEDLHRTHAEKFSPYKSNDETETNTDPYEYDIFHKCLSFESVTYNISYPSNVKYDYSIHYAW